MEVHIGWETFTELLRQHWVSAFFLLLTLTTILVILGVRWWVRRWWKRALEERFQEEHELEALPPLRPEDQRALELIKEFRKEVWELPESELQISLDALNQRAMRIVQAMAAVYHPEAEVPQYEASLVESLQLIRRVSTRLTRMASGTPFKIMGNRKISDYQRFYQVYRKINENPILQVLKRTPHLSTVARWAMNVKNLGNPLYWASKELSREGYFIMIRWFTLTLISQVGREAMRLYSGRPFQSEEERDAALICYRLFAFMQQWGGPSASEWSAFVDFVSNHSTLESEAKVNILSRCSKERLPKDLEAQQLQTKSGGKWYREGLKRILESNGQAPPVKTALIQKELVSLSEPEKKDGE